MTRATTVTRKAFTQQEAADMYGVSLATIKRARVAGDLIMHNIGSDHRPSWRVTAEALADWFAGLTSSS